MEPNRSIPDSTVVPILPYPDVREAVAWLERVFGFTERMQIANHRAQMTVGDGHMIVAEYIDRDHRPLPGAQYVCHQTRVRVEDVQAHYDNAVKNNADIIQPPVDHEYGEREYVVRDIGGHRWTFAQTLADRHPHEWAGDDVVLKQDP